MPFTFFDHTGDVGIDVRASTLDGLFWEAAAALVETITDGAALVPDVTVEVRLAAMEIDLLLLDWLSELLFRFETSGFLPAHADIDIRRDAGPWQLRAQVKGERTAGGRLPLKTLVKAVTYHALRVEEDGQGWAARVVLDI